MSKPKSQPRSEPEPQPESQQIIFDLPPEIEFSEEELAKLIEKFQSDIIDIKPEWMNLQTKVNQVQARVRTK